MTTQLTKVAGITRLTIQPRADWMEPRPGWSAYAACAGANVEDFYPNDSEPFIHNELCFGCPVQEECMSHGVLFEHYGYFGGLSNRTRRSLRRKAKRFWLMCEGCSTYLLFTSLKTRMRLCESCESEEELDGWW